jgi:hypothetical protein
MLNGARKLNVISRTAECASYIRLVVLQADMLNAFLNFINYFRKIQFFLIINLALVSR